MTKEPDMYPLVDSATYLNTYENFEDLKLDVEVTSEGLNMIQSWFVSSEEDDLKYGDEPEFGLTIFMPRKGQTAQFSTAHFDREEVAAWLNGYVKRRVLDWYGWE